MRRVVVTGLGMIAPTGNTVSEAWDAALAGKSGVGLISQFDRSASPVKIAAEVKNFDPTSVLGEKQARQCSRFVQFAAVAVTQAVEDSGLDPAVGSDRYGCILGVGLGGIGVIEEQTLCLDQRGPRRVWPFTIPYAIPNMAAGFVSVLAHLRGPNYCTSSACASGTHAIGEAFLHVRSGTADAILAGGAESTITPLLVAAFARMHALSTRNEDPTAASRPFDLGRDGFVMGEGCGMLVLEELEHAQRRGAPIYAELVGYGLSADAHHITSPPPDGEGAARCMASALRMAETLPNGVDYINAHGTSTLDNDRTESAAIQTVFGPDARNVSVSSTKGVTGHCLGAAGGVEAVYTVLAVKRAIVPPTVNYSEPDPDCRLDYTPNTARERTIRCAMSNSFGFGGQNASIVFRRFEAS